MVDRGIFNEKKGIPSYLRPDLREGTKALPTGFAPGGWDVICHSNKEADEHIGNRRFDFCIKNHLETYNNAKSRAEKSAVISDIVVSIKESSAAGIGFVRYDMERRRWYQVSDKIARDKVGKNLRAYNSKKKQKDKPKQDKPNETPPSSRTRAISEEFIRAPLELPPAIPGVPNTIAWTQMRKMDGAHTIWSDAQLAPPNTSIDKISLNDCYDEDTPSDDNSLIDWFEADVKGMKS
ncbi:unnamed protein product [Cylindrotheca closterium]|uniref:DUF6824 domain-containing protein n=1 Tax=Cylindrotheca closterium TaxID=2856 RepID=A0AAD2CE86_9STRA|nr:unnamed protein product [Cylindrotheca closterium]